LSRYDSAARASQRRGSENVTGGTASIVNSSSTSPHVAGGPSDPCFQGLTTTGGPDDAQNKQQYFSLDQFQLRKAATG